MFRQTLSIRLSRCVRTGARRRRPADGRWDVERGRVDEVEAKGKRLAAAGGLVLGLLPALRPLGPRGLLLRVVEPPPVARARRGRPVARIHEDRSALLVALLDRDSRLQERSRVEDGDPARRGLVFDADAAVVDVELTSNCSRAASWSWSRVGGGAGGRSSRRQPASPRRSTISAASEMTGWPGTASSPPASAATSGSSVTVRSSGRPSRSRKPP